MVNLQEMGGMGSAPVDLRPAGLPIHWPEAHHGVERGFDNRGQRTHRRPAVGAHLP